MRFHTFTVTVGDPEEYNTKAVRDTIQDAIKESDLVVIEMDEGVESKLEEIE